MLTLAFFFSIMDWRRRTIILFCSAYRVLWVSQPLFCGIEFLGSPSNARSRSLRGGLRISSRRIQSKHGCWIAFVREVFLNPTFRFHWRRMQFTLFFAEFTFIFFSFIFHSLTIAASVSIFRLRMSWISRHVWRTWYFSAIVNMFLAVALGRTSIITFASLSFLLLSPPPSHHRIVMLLTLSMPLSEQLYFVFHFAKYSYVYVQESARSIMICDSFMKTGSEFQDKKNSTLRTGVR